MLDSQASPILDSMVGINHCSCRSCKLLEMYGVPGLFYIVLTSLCLGLKVSPTQILESVVLGVYEVIRVTKIWLILVVEPFVY